MVDVVCGLFRSRDSLSVAVLGRECTRMIVELLSRLGVFPLPSCGSKSPFARVSPMVFRKAQEVTESACRKKDFSVPLDSLTTVGIEDASPMEAVYYYTRMKDDKKYHTQRCLCAKRVPLCVKPRNAKPGSCALKSRLDIRCSRTRFQAADHAIGKAVWKGRSRASPIIRELFCGGPVDPGQKERDGAPLPKPSHWFVR